jgi:hypothetical protein
MVQFKQSNRSSSKDKNILKENYNMLGKYKKLLSWIITLLNVVFLSVDGMKHLRVLSLCNLPKAMEVVIEATSKPLRVRDLSLQDSERDLSVKFRFV